MPPARQVCIAIFNPDVLSFDIAKISKAVLERLHEAASRRWRSKKANDTNIPLVLRLDRERRGEEATCQGADERPAVHHSMT